MLWRDVRERVGVKLDALIWFQESVFGREENWIRWGFSLVLLKSEEYVERLRIKLRVLEGDSHSSRFREISLDISVSLCKIYINVLLSI